MLYFLSVGKPEAFTIRLFGIDCPEVKPYRSKFPSEEARLEEKRKGMLAKTEVTRLIKGNRVLLDVTGKDKYGRLLASVFFRAPFSAEGDDTIVINLTEHLISHGFGKEYFGGTKN